MPLDRNKPIPLYEQLRLLLQDKILLGDYPVGTLLPTEKELCEEYGISRITARKSLEELTRIGLIERVQGKGTIVSDHKPVASTPQIRGHKRTMEEFGYRGGGEILSHKLIKPNTNLLKLFELPEDSPQKFRLFRRLRYLNDDPVVLMNSFVREEIGEKLLTYELKDASFFSLFEEITKRVVVDCKARISATLASPEVANILNTKVGDPLIWYQAVSYLEGGIPIEVNYSLFLGDKFYFQTSFYRTMEKDIGKEFFEQITNTE
ncbi:MAG: GntR family transcriptional regulator [Desulfobacteraceae bacterium]